MDCILEETIQAPRDRVFQLATDFPRAAELVSGITKIEMLTDGPVKPGTRFRETRVMFGKEAVEEMELTSLSAPQSFVLEAESHGAKYHTEYTLESRGPSETHLRMHFRAQPQTVLAKVLSVVFRPLAGSVAKAMRKDLIDLKQVAEGPGEAAG